MTSGEIKAFLVFGDYAISKVKSLKKNLRRKFNLRRFDLRNLVHTPDEGLEYYLQFTCLFSSKHKITDCCGFADANIYLNNRQVLFQTTSINKENIIFWGQIRYFKFKNSCIKLISFNRNDQYINNKRQIESFIQETHDQGGFICLGDLELSQYSDDLFKYLKNLGVIASMVYDIDYLLDDSKDLQDYLTKYNMISLGGSNNKIHPFSITIGQDTFDKLIIRSEEIEI